MDCYDHIHGINIKYVMTKQNIESKNENDMSEKNKLPTV